MSSIVILCVHIRTRRQTFRAGRRYLPRIIPSIAATAACNTFVRRRARHLRPGAAVFDQHDKGKRRVLVSQEPPQTTRAAARRRRPPPYRTLRRGQAPDNCRRRSLRSRYSHELTHGVRSLFVNKTSRRLRVTGVSMPDAPLTERTKRGVTATPSFANAPIRRRNASGLTRSVDCPIPDQASSQLSSSCVRQSCPLRL